MVQICVGSSHAIDVFYISCFLNNEYYFYLQCGRESGIRFHGSQDVLEETGGRQIIVIEIVIIPERPHLCCWTKHRVSMKVFYFNIPPDLDFLAKMFLKKQEEEKSSHRAVQCDKAQCMAEHDDNVSCCKLKWANQNRCWD